MPGSTPAISQLDWLSSTTAMIVLSWSKATRDLLKSFSWGIVALRQLFASDDGAISFAACLIPSLCWRKTDSNLWSHFQRGQRFRDCHSVSRSTAPAARVLSSEDDDFACPAAKATSLAKARARAEWLVHRGLRRG